MSESNFPTPPAIPPAGNTPPNPAPVNPPAPPAVPPTPQVPNVQLPVGQPATPLEALASAMNISSAEIAQITAAALAHNDASIIDKSYLQSKNLGHMIPLVEQLVQQHIAQQEASINTATQAVYAMFGGEAGWKQNLSVFQAKAPEALKQTVTFLMDNGQYQSGAEVLKQFVSSNGLVPTGTIPGVQGGMLPNTQQGLSKQQFQEAYAELSKKAGNRSLESREFLPQLQDLYARRAIGRKAGL